MMETMVNQTKKDKEERIASLQIELDEARENLDAMKAQKESLVKRIEEITVFIDTTAAKIEEIKKEGLCPHCQQEYFPGSLFCNMCGWDLRTEKTIVKCMVCGAELPENAKFCLECGTKVGEVAPAPVEEEESMQKPEIQDIVSDSPENEEPVEEEAEDLGGNPADVVPAGFKKCPNPDCGAIVPADYAFCDTCGTKLA